MYGERGLGGEERGRHDAILNFTAELLPGFSYIYA